MVGRLEEEVEVEPGGCGGGVEEAVAVVGCVVGCEGDGEAGAEGGGVVAGEVDCCLMGGPRVGVWLVFLWE